MVRYVQGWHLLHCAENDVLRRVSHLNHVVCSETLGSRGTVVCTTSEKRTGSSPAAVREARPCEHMMRKWQTSLCHTLSSMPSDLSPGSVTIMTRFT